MYYFKDKTDLNESKLLYNLIDFQLLGENNMKNLKKQGILTLSTVLSLGILAPSVSAATPIVKQQEVQFRVASEDTVVTKSELIERVKKLFPGKFDFVNEKDFYMNSGYHDPDDDAIRYELGFHKELNEQQVYGHIGFIGEDLELERFYYEPIRTAEALFPAKVSKEKAEEIASKFLAEISKEKDYQLNDDQFYYNPGNQSLTEPIRYSFSFVRTKNNVPIQDQQIQVSVLGSGEVIEFYHHSTSKSSQTFDDVKKALAEDKILSLLKKNLSFDLQYKLNIDYQTGNRDVELVYQPTGEIIGVHAISSDWQTANGFSKTLPKEREIKFISDQPLKPKDHDFTLEEAKAYAEKLLKIDSKKVQLSIESVEERENEFGQNVIRIQYMYNYQNGGYGTDLQLDSQTGEILQYHDLKREIFAEIGEDKKSGKTINREKALEQAVKHLKEHAPSYLHHYAMPVVDGYYEDERGIYYFHFPRIVNNIPVEGDQISVTVASDGSLVGLNVNYQEIENWPSSEDIISKEEATDKFLDELSIKLGYVKENGKTDKHYNLVYTPVFNGNSYSYLDALTGEWQSTGEEELAHPVVSHPYAADELNYLINAGIIPIEDGDAFDADAPVTKGQAIEVLMKSLSRFYDYYDPYQENMSQSFENIGPDHALYQVIERAVDMDILDSGHSKFDVDAQLTKEELAVWYIRSLDLELAAEHSSIFKLDFTDSNKINPEYTGYVALANVLGLLTANENQFNPNQEISYADLAVSIFRVAHKVYESGQEMGY